ncbi:predicted protein [Phaeodactylum tricornutum CCAP 1055/1]|jgi:hypothetical protein|uniref:Uncharacterized protein n=2 Tax=Phaeodactylum tricornutum TaxID=2850 RepID=B7GD34_PHATC|nr:predicted protein [Phaeodactylum tricornutum CCAP 1055/1]EEC43510.1 predicted protein [Phaeodactylum tricornutum CCAP 1055/1]|eukprot:XP_002185063.1 predicted protein [Phaeodactylum tricornutum CCAP 1055/1]
MLSTIAFSKFASASFLAVLLSPASLPSELSSNAAPPVPVLEVIKVYGRLASASCFGKTAPPGSSCQVTSDEMKDKLGLTDSSTILNRDEFGKRLSSLSFQWPLKPYGVDKGLEKTVMMNKGAETSVYMEELEVKGLYDRRNPTGPLPTSLRSKLNVLLQEENLDPNVVNIYFAALSTRKELTAADIDALFLRKAALDYYDFIQLVGASNVVWP